MQQLARLLVAPVVDPPPDVRGVEPEAVAQHRRSGQQRLPRRGQRVAAEDLLVDRQTGDRRGGPGGSPSGRSARSLTAARQAAATSRLLLLSRVNSRASAARARPRRRRVPVNVGGGAARRCPSKMGSTTNSTTADSRDGTVRSHTSVPSSYRTGAVARTATATAGPGRARACSQAQLPSVGAPLRVDVAALPAATGLGLAGVREVGGELHAQLAFSAGLAA